MYKTKSPAALKSLLLLMSSLFIVFFSCRLSKKEIRIGWHRFRLLEANVTKTYRKADIKKLTKIGEEAKTIPKKLSIDRRPGRIYGNERSVYNSKRPQRKF